jgi:very-long-chain enoyl-CoA reductase
LVTQDTVTALKKAFHGKNKKFYPARQRLTLPPKDGAKSGEVLKDGARLSECGLSNGSVVHFKDLGTQV